jgi:hypothetical protein
MDQLLEWCSAREQGSRSSFRDAHAWCTGDERPGAANRALAILETLGHVEVDWAQGGDWAVNPPVLALLRGAGGNALAVGARSPALKERLERRGSLRAVGQRDGPEAWYVSVSTIEELGELALSAGLGAAMDVAGAYSELLPSLDDVVTAGRREVGPGGVEISRFDRLTLRFEPFPWPRGRWPDGAYEHRGAGPTTYALRLEDDGCSVVDRRTAVHFELRRLRRETGDGQFRAFDWSTEGDTLLCDRRTPLPLLQLRTAVLATGLLPQARTLDAHPRLGTRRVEAFVGVHILAYEAIARSLDPPCP